MNPRTSGIAFLALLPLASACAVHPPSPANSASLAGLISGSAMSADEATRQGARVASAERDGGNTQMRPLPSELLAEPIALPECPGIRIIEWRATPGHAASTRPSAAAIGVIDRVCDAARRGFDAFVTRQGIATTRLAALHADVCLLPADARSGEDYRNLNDVTWRFRSRTFAHEGSALPRVWGYHQRSTQTVYVRNDVFNEDGTPNRRFETVLAHEIFHALSYGSGLYERRAGDKDAEEEATARRFTQGLGIGE